jgi:hypothetical protein
LSCTAPFRLSLKPARRCPDSCSDAFALRSDPAGQEGAVRVTLRSGFVALGALAAVACAPGPGAHHAPGDTGAVGALRLVPREGVTPGTPGGGAYGDRRLRDVEFVDYAHPGFAVVYLEGGRSPGGQIDLSIRETRTRVVLSPEHAVVGVGGTIVVRNEAREPHVVSCPAAQLVRRIAPGERVEIPASDAGERSIFLLDAKAAEALVFVAPGPFAVTADDGSFALHDLPAGTQRLRAWHPRFPPATRSVELVSGELLQVDIELGVDLPQAPPSASR